MTKIRLTDTAEMNKLDWYGCYDGSWQSAPLVPDAYAHPAKIPFALAERIYRHMLAEGWLAPGDVVLDPFGGIAGTSFHACLYGCHWLGVELEQKFVDLGQQNIALWNTRYAPHFPAWGAAQLVQGDSRRLLEVVSEAGAAVSSPPYNLPMSHDHNGSRGGLRGTTPSEPGAFVKYGCTPGQLGAMPAGAIVSSPPYAQARIDGNGDEGSSALRDEDGAYLRGAEGWQQRKALGSRYGETSGNLANLPADGVVSSPPYADALSSGEGPGARYDFKSHSPGNAIKQTTDANYGASPENLGNGNGDTFWSAARTIVEQCYTALRPGAYAAWVTGDYVRDKQRVLFGEQWLALCEAVGFEAVAWAVAWKSKHHGNQLDIFGHAIELRKDKVSFFRRLANERNPEAAIRNEDVIFVRKPQWPQR